jgi:3-deoxy-7-phosphoheptulonate synthase
MQAERTEKWVPDSWREYPVIQLPEYGDLENLEKCYRELKDYPPLVTSWEVKALKDKLATAARGESFLLQGGDCAETFENVTSPQIVNILKVLLQMSLVLIHETNLPVIRVGRLAGQYAKPRSKDKEVVNGEEMPIYRGDLINSYEADKNSRQADPKRLLEGYQKAAMTLNFIRALSEGGGFADLHYPGYWELSFMKNNRYYNEYMAMVRSINNAINFVETISPNKLTTLQRVHIYTSHEALNLYYDSAQTRRVPHKQGWYNLSAHMVWLGNRTRAIDGAHVEYLRGIQNPIGIKLGPPYDVDELLKLIEVLNPQQEAGKITLISRFGKDLVGDELPKVIRAVEKAGFNVLWSCDPMHGNTFSTDDELKTRHFDDILSEIKQTFSIHRAEGTNLGGVHLELTGDNVTECVGGAKGLDEDGLKSNYQTYCDPRLNYEQSLEMAFLIAKEKKKILKADS